MSKVFNIYPDDDLPGEVGDGGRVHYSHDDHVPLRHLVVDCRTKGEQSHVGGGGDGVCAHHVGLGGQGGRAVTFWGIKGTYVLKRHDMCGDRGIGAEGKVGKGILYASQIIANKCCFVRNADMQLVFPYNDTFKKALMQLFWYIAYVLILGIK